LHEEVRKFIEPRGINFSKFIVMAVTEKMEREKENGK